MIDEEKLKKLYIHMYEAMIGKDIYTLKKIHHPSFTLTHMNGMRQTRSEYFDDILNNQLDYQEVEHDVVMVEIKGDQAELTGHSRVKAAVYGGKASIWPLALQFQCRRIDGNWLLIKCEASTY